MSNTTRDPPGERTRVLLVEDDPDIVPLVVRELRELDPGCAVQWCTDSETASRALHADRYDAVVADYMIEGAGTGWSLHESARQIDSDLGYGLLSALPLEALEHLGVPFLQKPFTPSTLRAFLRTLLVTRLPKGPGASARDRRDPLERAGPPRRPARERPPRAPDRAR